MSNGLREHSERQFPGLQLHAVADGDQGDPVHLGTHLFDEPAFANTGLASHQRQRHLSPVRSAGCLKQFCELTLASYHRPAAEPTHASMLTDRRPASPCRDPRPRRSWSGGTLAWDTTVEAA